MVVCTRQRQLHRCLGNGERNVPPPDRNRSRLRDPHLFGGRQAFVIPFSSIYEPARIVRMRAGSLLPEYIYRFAAAAAPVVQTAGPGMPPAAPGETDALRTMFLSGRNGTAPRG